MTSVTVKNSRNDNTPQSGKNDNFGHFEKAECLEIVDFGGEL